MPEVVLVDDIEVDLTRVPAVDDDMVQNDAQPFEVDTMDLLIPALIALALFIALDVAAIRFGADSRDR